MFYGFLMPGKGQPKGDIVTLAKQYLGVPYRYGGSTPAGFDCSGYMLFLFHQFGKELPRAADQQATVGSHVDIDNLRPGNIVFFATTGEPDISHTGLYIGDHKFIHASSTAKKVIISNLAEPYWRNCFQGARQILP
jgi:cell wall-associated NlpC family hydrolase